MLNAAIVCLLHSSVCVCVHDSVLMITNGKFQIKHQMPSECGSMETSLDVFISTEKSVLFLFD